jgi:hypothetical protein
MVGCMVHSKATQVTAEAQCRRYYSSLWKEKWVTGEVWGIEKRPVNGRNQRFFDVEYTLPGGLKKSVTLRDIHCRPGAWSNTTTTPDAPLLGVDTEDQEQEEEEQDHNSTMNLLEAQSVVDDGVSSLDESQPVRALFPDPEPVNETQREQAAREAQPAPAPPPPAPPPPAPVPEAVVQRQVPGDEALEDSDESDDDGSDIAPTVTTDNIHWYTDMDYCMRDINGSVETINWQFKTEMGEEMTEDDDVGMEQSPLDYLWPASLHKQ